MPIYPKTKDDEEPTKLNINKTIVIEDELIKRDLELKATAEEEAKKDPQFDQFYE